MSLTTPHRFDRIVVSTTAASVASGVAGVINAPCRGKIVEVGTNIGSVVSTANATVTTSIAGTAITGGSFVIATASSAIGDHDSASPTAVNTCTEGQLIKFAFTGSGTAGGHVYCYANIIPD